MALEALIQGDEGESAAAVALMRCGGLVCFCLKGMGPILLFCFLIIVCYFV